MSKLARTLGLFLFLVLTTLFTVTLFAAEVKTEAKSVEVKPIEVKPIEIKPIEDLKTFNEKSADQKSVEAVEEEPTFKKDTPADNFLSKTATNKPMEPPSFFFAFLKMIFALLIVLGIILLLYYLIKKYFGNSLLGIESGGAIKVLATKYIGQKNMVYIIDIMEKIIVVAMSGTEITPLTEITDPQAMERMRNQISKQKEDDKPFKKFFSDRVKSDAGSDYKPKEENYDLLDELNDKIKDKIDK